MIKINNKAELDTLLKIFAEESVKKAKKTLNEDSAPSKFSSALNAAEKQYGVKLSEEEEPEANDAESSEKKPEKEKKQPEDIESSLDNLIKVINSLRAGRSTKNKDIEDSLQGYYDKLSEDERKVLLVFLKQLANILQGAIEGEDAMDPSDPPLNADIVINKGDQEEKQKKTKKSVKKAARPSGEEDTSPPVPIAVDKPQNLSEIRKRVQRLMKRY